LRRLVNLYVTDVLPVLFAVSFTATVTVKEPSSVFGVHDHVVNGL